MATSANTQCPMVEADRQAAHVVGSIVKIPQRGETAACALAKSDANGANESKGGVRNASGSAATREAVRETDTTPTALSMVSLLNEQARHTMEFSLALGCARTLAEFSKVQSDFIGSSFQRLGKFNECYLDMIRGGMVSARVDSSQR